MVILRFPALLLIASLMTKATAFVTLECKYRMSSIPWPILREVYECYIEGDLFITHPQMTVSNASGEHRAWKRNDHVAGFYARSSNVLYFPTGIDKIFPNLRLIAIAMSKMRVIKQENLVPFDQLRYLCLFNNEIATIERHIFAYNLNLEAVDLRENRISRINVNIFDYLINLQILLLSDAFNNSCLSSDANDREAVVRLIEDLKDDCNEDEMRRLSAAGGRAKKVQVDESSTEFAAEEIYAQSGGGKVLCSHYCSLMLLITVVFN